MSRYESELFFFQKRVPLLTWTMRRVHVGSRLRVERRGSHVVPSSSAATGEREREIDAKMYDVRRLWRPFMNEPRRKRTDRGACQLRGSLHHQVSSSVSFSSLFFSSFPSNVRSAATMATCRGNAGGSMAVDRGFRLGSLFSVATFRRKLVESVICGESQSEREMGLQRKEQEEDPCSP